MKVIDAFLLALRGIAAHKMRASLTMLGIIIGVTAVVSLMSIGRGAEASIVEQIESLGTDVLHIIPGRGRMGVVTTSIGSSNTLTYEDALAIANPLNCPSVSKVAPVVEDFAQVVAGDKNIITRYYGTTPEAEEIFDWRVVQGEAISRQEIERHAQLAVLGPTVAKTLFGDADPVGERIRINDYPFRVVGVLAGKGSFMTIDMDDMIAIPITTAKDKLDTRTTPQGGRVVTSISAQVSSKEAMADAKQEIEALLRQRHRITGQNDFTIVSEADIVAVIQDVMGILTILLGLIAGISLLVGGIGIMNIMLVSVTERTREIGIRKAVGAKRRDIMTQFLIEAAVLSLAGGMVGVLLGWGASQLFSGLNLGFGAVFSLDAVILAFTVSAAIGIFFGLYPAARAARLHPIEALR